MCGIAGVVGPMAQRGPVVRAMTSAIRHRGPDDEGFYDDADCSLGHRRLSVLDLSPAGQQPMASADGNIQVVFNGEIYNHVELRQALERAGHRFRSRTDTEVIVYLYQEHGDQFIDHLRGMFAIAIWDARRRRLLLARDRFGQKPLFYTQLGGAFAFGSEIKALLACPQLSHEVDPHAIDMFLSLHFVPAPHSCYAAIRRLEAATCLVFEPGRPPRTWRYWSLADVQPRKLREPEALEELDAHLTRTIREQLVADVPVGMFLSGGIDSSMILAKVSEVGRRGIDTFSVGYAEGAFSELPFAKQVADQFGAQHHPIILDSNEAKDPERLIDLFDEPFADVAAIPTAMLCRNARQRVTVALTGDGGDELLGGYDYHVLGYWLDRVSAGAGLRRKVAQLAANVIPRDARFRSPLRTLRRALEAMSFADWRAATTALRSSLLLEHRDQLFEPEFRAAVGGEGPYQYLYADPTRQGGSDSVERLFRVGGDRVLADQLLFKTDIASMAAGLECRSPFLDRELAEFVTSLPLELKVRGFRGKHLLRKLLSRHVGANIWKRRKMGFTMPVEEWLKTDLAELVNDTLLAPGARINQFVRPAEVARLYREHCSGLVNWRRILWSLLLLELWLRRLSQETVAVAAS